MNSPSVSSLISLPVREIFWQAQHKQARPGRARFGPSWASGIRKAGQSPALQPFFSVLLVLASPPGLSHHEKTEFVHLALPAIAALRPPAPPRRHLHKLATFAPAVAPLQDADALVTRTRVGRGARGALTSAQHPAPQGKMSSQRPAPQSAQHLARDSLSQGTTA